MDTVPDDWKLMIGDANDSDALAFSYQELADIFNFSPPPASLLELKIIAAVIYSGLAILGVIANLIFCCVIWKTEKLHTVTHLLMTNLAVSNLLFLLFHPPYFLSTYILETNWHFGTIMCKASFSIGYVTVTASFYFMSLVAIDRWLAIFRRKQRICRKRGIQVTIGAWVVAAIVATPYVINSKVLEMGSPIKGFMSTTRCGGEPIAYYRELLTFTFLVQYCLPLVVMVPAYSHLAYFLWRRPTIGVQSKEKTKKAVTRRKRLIFTLIGILVIQITCWMPLFSVGILHRINPSLSFLPYIITSMIALLGVLFTPICYLTNDGFINQLRQMFPCICKKKNNSNGNQPDTSRRLLGVDLCSFLRDSEMAMVPSTSQLPVSGTATPKMVQVQSGNEIGTANV